MFKITIYFLFFLLSALNLEAQKAVSDDLVKQAVELNGEGSYNRAIGLLHKALQNDKNDLSAKYELAYAYLQTGNSVEAEKYSKQILKQGDSLKLEAFLILGAAYDQIGKQKKSLKIYTKAVNEFPGNNLALFNLGLSYYNNDNLEMAERSIIRSIDVDRSYPGSHYLMAHIMLRKGETIKAMLSLYYFLLLEQDTPRAEESYNMLEELWKSGINSSGGKTIVAIDKKENDFYKMVDLEIKLKSVPYLNDDPGDKLRVFASNTNLLFDVISQKYKGNFGFWEQTYLDFFKDMYKKGFTDSFAYYISNTTYRPQVLVWLSDNYSEFNSFINWIELQE